MEPINTLDDILKLGQLPISGLTLWILYQIMITLKVAIARMETVLEIVTDDHEAARKVRVTK